MVKVLQQDWGELFFRAICGGGSTLEAMDVFQLNVPHIAGEGENADYGMHPLLTLRE